MKLVIRCCPTCGNALAKSGAIPPGYRKPEGLVVRLLHYPSGFTTLGGKPGFFERFYFREEICEGCSTELRRLLDPAIAFIQERDMKR